MPKLPPKSPLAALFLALIRGYQRALSPLMGHQCRFAPTCSHYAHDAIVTFGALRGGALALWRILRCNPWCRGGLDPVPVKKAHAKSPHGLDHDQAHPL